LVRSLSRKGEKEDPRYFVLDEVVGMLISLLYIPHSIIWYSASFFLFRIFDIIKPSPVRESERIPNGWGVMTDDLLAGLYVFGILHIIRYAIILIK